MENENNQNPKPKTEQEFIIVTDPKTGEQVKFPRKRVEVAKPGESVLPKPWENLPKTFRRGGGK